MSCYKALISKKGEILSLSDEGEDTDKPCMDIAPGSKYPDVIFVNASDATEAEKRVLEKIREAELRHEQHEQHS
jgi:hypothetical protein